MTTKDEALKPWQDIADAAGILRAHNHMGLADRLLRHAEALAEQPDYKFFEDGKVVLKNPEVLSQRLREQLAQPSCDDVCAGCGMEYCECGEKDD